VERTQRGQEEGVNMEAEGRATHLQAKEPQACWAEARRD
jgi:hypothetical protein